MSKVPVKVMETTEQPPETSTPIRRIFVYGTLMPIVWKDKDHPLRPAKRIRKVLGSGKPVMDRILGYLLAMPKSPYPALIDLPDFSARVDYVHGITFNFSSLSDKAFEHVLSVLDTYEGGLYERQLTYSEENGVAVWAYFRKGVTPPGAELIKSGMWDPGYTVRRSGKVVDLFPDKSRN